MKPISHVKPSLYAKPGSMSGVHSALTTRQPTAEQRRRAQRVLLRMPVLVHVAKNPKPIEGFTHTVSATGGMIILPEGFAQGSKFTLENPKTQQRVEVSVVRSLLEYRFPPEHQLTIREEPASYWPGARIVQGRRCYARA